MPSPFVDSYSQLILAELERRQLFVVPLDNERRWYRYHHLFADLLRARLREASSAEAVAELHRRTSAWYEGQVLVVEAVHHALAAEDWEQAGRLIEAHGAHCPSRAGPASSAIVRKHQERASIASG
jgi:LuxR family maltose regulon positive regulatory protein